MYHGEVPTTTITLDRAPLENHLRAIMGPTVTYVSRHEDRGPTNHVDGYTVLAAVEQIGVSKQVWQRWAHTGLTVIEADRAAVALGLTPELLWGQDWDRP